MDIRFICLLGLFVLAGCGGGASESDERGVSEFDSIEQVTQEEAAQEETVQEETVQEETVQEETVQEETVQEETAQEETPQEICIIREA